MNRIEKFSTPDVTGISKPLHPPQCQVYIPQKSSHTLNLDQKKISKKINCHNLLVIAITIIFFAIIAACTFSFLGFFTAVTTISIVKILGLATLAIFTVATVGEIFKETKNDDPDNPKKSFSAKVIDRVKNSFINIYKLCRDGITAAKTATATVMLTIPQKIGQVGWQLLSKPLGRLIVFIIAAGAIIFFGKELLLNLARKITCS